MRPPEGVRRPQCDACPWRELSTIPAYALDAARKGEIFTCHTRMGPCPGPYIAGVSS